MAIDHNQDKNQRLWFLLGVRALLPNSGVGMSTLSCETSYKTGREFKLYNVKIHLSRSQVLNTPGLLKWFCIGGRQSPLEHVTSYIKSFIRKEVLW